MIEVQHNEYNLEDIPIKGRQIEHASIKDFIEHGRKVKGRCLMITTNENGLPVVTTMELYLVGSKEKLENIIHLVKVFCEDSN